MSIFESAYSAAYGEMRNLLGSALPGLRIDDKELRMFACSLAVMAHVRKHNLGGSNEAVAVLQPAILSKVGDFDTFEDRFMIYESLIVDTLSRDKIAAELLWTEPARYITGNISSTGFLIGNLGIYDVLASAMTGGNQPPQSEKPAKSGGCAVLLLLLLPLTLVVFLVC